MRASSSWVEKGSQHDDGQFPRTGVSPPAPRQGHTGLPGQHPIQQHEVRQHRINGHGGLFGVLGQRHVEAGMTQVDRDQFADRGFVLDYEHGWHDDSFVVAVPAAFQPRVRAIDSTVSTGWCRTSRPLTM
jgi:hypothetical protein